MLKGTLKRSKGITLIALVVTIIVLLILAGISISMLMGQNGILNRAAESKREHTVAQEREAIAIAYSASMNVDNIGKVTGLELQNELDKIMKNTAVTENDTDLNILFKDTLHRYTISQDGTITKKDDLTPEEANKIVRILSSNMVLTADGTVKYIGNESLNTTDCTKLNTSDAKIITNNGIIKSAEGYFIDNKVGVYDTTADVSRAVAVSDAYVGSHYSSIIALFEVINKPIFRIDSKKFLDRNSVTDRKKADAVDVFNKPQDKDFFGCYESINYTVEDFLDDLVNNNLGEVIEKQKKESKIAANLDGSCGEKVYQYMINILRQQN